MLISFKKIICRLTLIYIAKVRDSIDTLYTIYIFTQLELKLTRRLCDVVTSRSIAL